jgi:hypothetical protein
MKHRNFLQGMTFLLVLTLLLSGCKKDDVPPDDFKQLSFDAEEVMDLLPDGLKNSNDENAQACVSYVESALDMAGFIDDMEVPDNATRSLSKSTNGGDTWQWSWNYGGESFTFYWSYDESGGKRYWTMDISYNNGPRYNYIDAWESEDGNQGEVVYNFGWAVIYSGEDVDETEFLYWKYTWNKDASGAYHLKYYWDGDSDEYEYLVQYDVVVNADGSGSVDYYMEGEVFYHMEWDVVGNGSWVMFPDTEYSMSGTWMA